MSSVVRADRLASPPLEQGSHRLLVYRSMSELEALIPAWESLLEKVPDATIFATWEWLSAWWDAFGGERTPLVLAYVDPTGALVGLALFSIEDHHLAFGPKIRLLRLMGDGSTDSDNLDLLVVPGQEAGFIAAVLDYIEQHQELWEIAYLNTMPDDSRAGTALLHELAARGWTYSRNILPGTVIDLPDDWETYRARLSYNERGQLGKYSRRLEKKYKVELRQCGAESGLEADLETFFALHQKRWLAEGHGGTFAEHARRRFYSCLSPVLARRGWLEFYLLHLDGKPVGGEYNFRYRDTVFSLQVGFDPDHSAERIGYVLRGYLLQKYIREGIRQYDFLFGEGGYKDRWAGRIRYYQDVHCAPPRTRAAAYLQVAWRLRQIKEWMRERLPRPAWAALRKLNQVICSL